MEFGRSLVDLLGYNCKGFTDSEAALDEILINPGGYDIFITDKTMPHLNGSELVERLRQNDIIIQVIMCTGYGDLSSIENAKKMGIDEVIMKPFNIHTLSSAIGRIVEKGRDKTDG